MSQILKAYTFKVTVEVHIFADSEENATTQLNANGGAFAEADRHVELLKTTELLTE